MHEQEGLILSSCALFHQSEAFVAKWLFNCGQNVPGWNPICFTGYPLLPLGDQTLSERARR